MIKNNKERPPSLENNSWGKKIQDDKLVTCCTIRSRSSPPGNLTSNQRRILASPEKSAKIRFQDQRALRVKHVGVHPQKEQNEVVQWIQPSVLIVKWMCTIFGSINMTRLWSYGMVRVWCSGLELRIVCNGIVAKVNGFFKRAWLSLGGKLSQKSWCVALWSFPLYDQIYVIQ